MCRYFVLSLLFVVLCCCFVFVCMSCHLCVFSMFVVCISRFVRVMLAHGATLIFSVSFQFYRMIHEGNPICPGGRCSRRGCPCRGGACCCCLIIIFIICVYIYIYIYISILRILNMILINNSSNTNNSNTNSNINIMLPGVSTGAKPKVLASASSRPCYHHYC